MSATTPEADVPVADARHHEVAETAPVLDFSGAVRVDPARVVLVDAEAAGEGGDTASSRCAAVLTGHCFGDVARFFADEATAWRVALGTVRAHHKAAGRPKRREIVVVSDAPGLPHALAHDAAVVRIPEDEAAIAAAMGPQTAALLLAPASIDGGLRFLPGFVLAAARQAADEYGVVLMFDESDAGLGRTGMAFAHEWRGVTPDLMLLDGLPVADDAGGISALVLGARLARSLPSGLPLLGEDAAAGLLALLGTAFAPGFEARVQGLGWMLEDRLATLRWRRPDLFSDTVGTGLVQGLACAGPAAPLAEALAEAGLRACALGNVLAFLPPLTVTEEEITAAGDILDAVVAALPPVP